MITAILTLTLHTVLVGQWAAHHPWEPQAGPDPREHAVVLPSGDDVIVFAGSGYEPQMTPLADAWRYDTRDDTWASLKVAGEEPTPAGGSMRPVKIDDSRWLLFGGYDGQFNCSNTLMSMAVDDETVTLEPVEQADAPPGRALHAFAADPKTGTLVVFGGVSREGFRGGTWIAKLEDGVYRWQQLEITDGPSPRFGMAYGFDEHDGRLIIASGQVEGAGLVTDAGVWALSLREPEPTWARIGEVPETNTVRNPCFAWDQGRRTLWIWCGTPDGRTNAPDLIRVHVDGEQAEVERIEREDEPQRRSSGAGVVLDGRVWFGFGNHAGGVMRDWVVWDPDADARSNTE